MHNSDAPVGMCVNPASRLRGSSKREAIALKRPDEVDELEDCGADERGRTPRSYDDGERGSFDDFSIGGRLRDRFARLSERCDIRINGFLECLHRFLLRMAPRGTAG